MSVLYTMLTDLSTPIRGFFESFLQSLNQHQGSKNASCNDCQDATSDDNDVSEFVHFVFPLSND